MATLAPYATFFYGINDAYWHGTFNHPTSDATTGVWTNTYADAGVGDSASLSYYSPRIDGFQFGASYMPEAGTEARSSSVYSTEGDDAFGVGANYYGSVGDTDVALSLGYASKEAPGEMGAADRTVTEIGTGISASMFGVSVGGGYSSMDNDDASDDLVQYDFGIMYGEGPWKVSVNFGNKSQDGMVDTDFSRLLGNYNLGPGINLAGAIGVDSHDSGNDTTFGAIALGVAF